MRFVELDRVPGYAVAGPHASELTLAVLSERDDALGSGGDATDLWLRAGRFAVPIGAIRRMSDQSSVTHHEEFAVDVFHVGRAVFEWKGEFGPVGFIRRKRAPGR